MVKTVNKNLIRYEEKLKESALFDSESLVEADGRKTDSEDGLTDEELKEVALDIAIDISRLMEKVSPDDILKISRDVANYIKFHVIGSEYDPDNNGEIEDEEEKPLDVDDDREYNIIDDEFTIDDDEEESESEDKDEEKEDAEEVEETSEKGDVIPDEFII